MRMKFMPWVKITALLLVSPGVFAATVIPEDIGSGYDFLEGGGILFNVEVVDPGDFTHSYAFEVKEGATPVHISTSSLEHSISMPQPIGDIDVYSIAGLTAILKDSAGNAISTPAASFTTAALEVGSYRVDVTGGVTGLAGGAYSAAVAPVPLPPALLFMGSAVVGLTAVGLRGRKGAKDSS